MIGECSESISSSDSLPEFVSRLKNENKRASMRNYHVGCVNICNNDKNAQAALKELLEKPCPSFIEDEIAKDKNSNILMSEFMEEYDKPFVQGQQTGIKNLDEILNKEGNGIMDASLVVILGGTKQGKTCVATTIFANRADKDFFSLLFTMEISKKESISNILAQKSMSHRGLVMKKDKSVRDKLGQATVDMFNKNMIIDDSQNMTIEHILLKARMYARKLPIKTIMIDYLTLIKKPVESSNSKDHEIWGDIVKSLRYLAKELNCIVIIVSQVTKDAGKRFGSPRPMAIDARDTSQLQYDCHLMLGTYVDSVELFGDDVAKQLEVSIILNRNGASGDVAYFDFDGGNLKCKSKYEGEQYNDRLKEQKKPKTKEPFLMPNFQDKYKK
jgi:replicative DNA helicase